MLEKLNRVNYLYDIYGSLLTDRQRDVFQLYYFDNFSLGEISEKYNISRQGVHDLLKRSVETLEKMETEMGLYMSYFFRREKLNEARRILNEDFGKGDSLGKLKLIVEELISDNERE